MEEVLDDAQAIAETLEIELTLPRIVERQQHRSNPPFTEFSEYWRKSFLIPYLDSLLSSLNDRFSENNTPAFSLLLLHPANMLKIPLEDLKSKIEDFASFYSLENINSEIELWHKVWADKNLASISLENMELCEVEKETNIFFPTIKRALHISMALPCTTCTVERSFSTLRRVKTWLRATMGPDRLNGLCMLSVHREMVKENKANIIEEVLNSFAANPRRLAFT